MVVFYKELFQFSLENPMTPMSVTCGHIPEDVLTEFKEVRTFVETMPTIDDEVLTCHSVCKAIALLHPNFSYVEGSFGGVYNHSWLTVKEHPNIILDLYPVAGASPFIVYAGISLLPWFSLYKEKLIKHDKKTFYHQVQKILASSSK